MRRQLAGMMLFLGFAGIGVSYGQDIHFSQFYENSILRNPALTGIFSGDYKVGVNYRTQWSDIGTPFQTALISGETRIAVNKEVGDYISFGIAATYDHAGSIDFNSYQIYPAINFNKSLEDVHGSYLSLGFAGGYIQRSVDQSKMTFTSQYVNGNYSQYNPTGENIPFRSIQNYDLSAGLSLNSSLGQASRLNYYAGVAAYHVTRPSETFTGEEDLIKLNMKWEGNVGFKYAITSQYGLTVHANYTNQAPYQEWIFGGLLSWKNVPSEMDPKRFVFYIGAFYRVKDAIIPTLKLDYQSVSVTLSYDVNNSALKPATSGVGGYELSLFLRGSYKRSQEAKDLTKCPRFEEVPNAAFN